MKKRLISLTLTVVLMFSLVAIGVPVASATVHGPADFGSGLRWDLNTTTGILRIYPAAGVGRPGSMPTGWGATGAPWHAHRASITSVFIFDGVSNIGRNAFNGLNIMASVSIPESVLSIGDNAFNGCRALTSIDIPRRITEIGSDVFIDCRALNNITVGGSRPGLSNNGRFGVDASGVLREINEGAAATSIRILKAQVGITSYTIEQDVTRIDAEAFARTGLTSIAIPGRVNALGLNAFSWNSSLVEVVFEGNAPQSLPAGNSNLFEGAASGFAIRYYPAPFSNGWPAPPSGAWRGYTVTALNNFIWLDPSPLTMQIGDTTRLQATVYPPNVSPAITWTSTPPGVVSVAPAQNGEITAEMPGEAIITATAPGFRSASRRVQVVQDLSASLRLDRPDIRLAAGSQETLTAIIYPAATFAHQDLIWSTNNPGVADLETITGARHSRNVLALSPGTAIITVRSADGSLRVTCLVIVTEAPEFVPVTSITIATDTIAAGATIDLGGTVFPENASFRAITWRVVSHSLSPAPTTVLPRFIAGAAGGLSVPMGHIGTVVVEATVQNGLAESAEWDFTGNLDYTQRFTINVVPFVPVSSISNVPLLAYVGVPLQLSGTVSPVSASYRDIEWSLRAETADAHFNTSTGVLIAQRPGVVSVRATIRNGFMSGVAFTQDFTIRVDPFITNTLELRANPGGSVSGGGAGQFPGGEVITITATPAHGYTFAGWHSTDGGHFADPGATTTQFTMPSNSTTVIAFFTFIGIHSGGGGGIVVLPTPLQYFTNSSVYIRDSGVSFGHVTMRDSRLFSSVSLNGRTLSRNAHFTLGRSEGFTEITLANGYLNTLSQGQHTLTVHFTDRVTVSAVFTVVWQTRADRVFDDVFPTDWYFSDVAFVSERGWMTARSSEPGRFRPSAPVTQGEVIDAMYRMAGMPTVLNQHGQPLQGRDAAFEWVRANGILPTGGQFNLNSAITRQDIAILFGRLVSVMRLRYVFIRAAPNFADELQISATARGHVNDLFRAGVINGRTATTFVPQGNMTRAEFAAMLTRFATTVL
jgi:uncharacterized protein YjdB